MMLRALVVGVAFLSGPAAAQGQVGTVEQDRQKCDDGPRVVRGIDDTAFVSISCFLAGYSFYTSDNNPINLQLAAVYFRRSCELDAGIGCSYLADMLRVGDGVPQNHREALSLYTQECTEVRGWGCAGLARMHYEGLATPQNYQIAAHYYSVACERGLVEEGCGNLGRMYALGQGVIQDYVRAHALFNLAAVQGNEVARSFREDVSRLMTPQQIADAQALARLCAETSIAECFP